MRLPKSASVQWHKDGWRVSRGPIHETHIRGRRRREVENQRGRSTRAARDRSPSNLRVGRTRLERVSFRGHHLKARGLIRQGPFTRVANDHVDANCSCVPGELFVDVADGQDAIAEDDLSLAIRYDDRRNPGIPADRLRGHLSTPA